ncbi:hypothetical protein O1C65_003750 [Vibrio cholerae]|nr:hypothetical protein [Vibrio cholerae]
MYKKFTLWVVLALPSFGVLAIENNEQIDKAVAFLEKACVTKGSSLDIQAEMNGTFMVKNIRQTGIDGSVVLTKTELEGFADAASALSASQADKMRECMQPHIDKILSVILTSQSEFKNEEIVIETKGIYFSVENLDSLMVEFSSSPYYFVQATEMVNSLKLKELHPAKTRAAMHIAESNGLIEYIKNDNGSGFVITNKGVNYVLKKGLVD